jgi:hypothetical protein
VATITKIEIELLNAVFADIVATAKAIETKTPDCAEACERIEEHGRRAYELLRTIDSRDPD